MSDIEYYKEIGMSEKEIDLIKTPIFYLVQDKKLFHSAMMAHNKMTLLIEEDNRKYIEANPPQRESLMAEEDAQLA